MRIVESAVDDAQLLLETKSSGWEKFKGWCSWRVP